jgi:hypothetical protein
MAKSRTDFCCSLNSVGPSTDPIGPERYYTAFAEGGLHGNVGSVDFNRAGASDPAGRDHAAKSECLNGPDAGFVCGAGRSIIPRLG